MDRIKKILCFTIVGIIFVMLFMLTSCSDDERVYPAKGIDVSSWQKEVDFSQLKKEGITFVILRIGTTKGKDSDFEKYYREAKHAGLDIGCYFYTYATDVLTAEKDAQNVIKWLRNKKMQYPVYIDVEDDCLLELSTDERMEICERYRQTLEEEKYLVGIYSNSNWYDQYLNYNLILENYEVWTANWSDTGKADKDMSNLCRVWQYTSAGKTKAIKGKVDMNISYFDYPTYVKENGYNNYPAKKTSTESL